jgi:hypothetical protein
MYRLEWNYREKDENVLYSRYVFNWFFLWRFSGHSMNG